MNQYLPPTPTLPTDSPIASISSCLTEKECKVLGEKQEDICKRLQKILQRGLVAKYLAVAIITTINYEEISDTYEAVFSQQPSTSVAEATEMMRAGYSQRILKWHRKYTIMKSFMTDLWSDVNMLASNISQPLSDLEKAKEEAVVPQTNTYMPGARTEDGKATASLRDWHRQTQSLAPLLSKIMFDVSNITKSLDYLAETTWLFGESLKRGEAGLDALDWLEQLREKNQEVHETAFNSVVIAGWRSTPEGAAAMSLTELREMLVSKGLGIA